MSEYILSWKKDGESHEVRFPTLDRAKSFADSFLVDDNGRQVQDTRITDVEITPAK